MRKILWLYSDNYGCGAYRAFIPALSLQDRYANSSMLPHQELRKLPYHELDDVDIVVFQRTVDPVALTFAKEAKKRGATIFFEMDDFLFKIPRHNPAHQRYKTRPVQNTIARLSAMVDGIIVSTEPLAEEVRHETGRKSDVFTCYNHLHPDVFGPHVLSEVPAYDKRGLTIIGWQGSATHNSDFRLIIPALKQIIKDFPQTFFRFLGNIPVDMIGLIPGDPGPPTEQNPNPRWDVHRGVIFNHYPTYLKFASFDVGLAPLTPNRFNRSKSNIKWLEYSAMNVACVASDVGPYADSIDHGVTGFLCRTVDDWYLTLKSLIEDPVLRVQISSQAFDYVWKNWSTTKARGWVDAFSSKLPCLTPFTPQLFPTPTVSLSQEQVPFRG